MKYHYVYILQSTVNEARYYVGRTKDLKQRLEQHNQGKVRYTANFVPWQIKTYLAFSDEESAVAFEKYLKSPSGRAFSKKRL
ncbi:MAG: GIY-YIG nuclease family protein [Verrucomicrobiota bacterium]